MDFSDLSQYAPAVVVAVAIAATTLFKQYATAYLAKRYIWAPAAVVGVLGAVLLTTPMEPRAVIWNAICYASISTFIVLIVRRIGAS